MKTRYKEIDIEHITGTNVCIGKRSKKVSFWRYLIEGAHVGPIMQTKVEALVGLDDYAEEWGINA